MSRIRNIWNQLKGKAVEAKTKMKFKRHLGHGEKAEKNRIKMNQRKGRDL